MAKPHIAVVDWKSHPRGFEDCDIEKEIISNSASVSYHLINNDEDWILAPPSLLSADVIVLWHNTPCSAVAISALTKCKAIIRNGVGYDTVDLTAASNAGITVCNIPDYGTEEVANHTIALALSLTRQLFVLDKHAKKLYWELPEQVIENVRRFSEMFFCIVGLGRIGSAVARKADALGFNVMYYDPFVSTKDYIKIDSLNELLTLADVLSIHCPSNINTKLMISNNEIDLLKNSAFLVNTARGDIVSKRSVINALNAGRLAGAGLDVVEDEPLKSFDEAATPNLICTCHSAFYSQEAIIDMRQKSATLAKAAVEGQPLYNIVNDEKANDN